MAACGSDSDSDSGSSSDTQLPSGIFAGAWNASDNSSGTLVALLLENETHALSDDGTRMNIKFSRSGDVVTGQGKYFYENGSFVASGTVNATGMLSGTTLTLQLVRSDGITNEAVLARMPESDESASFAKLEGAYQPADQSADINFSDIGVITGSDDDNCVYNGDVDIPNAAVNVYKVHLNATGCAYSGDYTGLAAHDNTDNSISVMWGNSSRLAGDDLFR